MSVNLSRRVPRLLTAAAFLSALGGVAYVAAQTETGSPRGNRVPAQAGGLPTGGGVPPSETIRAAAAPHDLTLADTLRTVAAPKYGKVHLLPATPETVQWGWFNNAQPPVMRIRPGDTVIMETLMHAMNQIVPGKDIAFIKKTRTDYPGRGPHSLTGPIYVEGAEPGDVLTVHINRIVPRAYGTNFNVPGLFGEFPKRFPDGQVKYFYLDMQRGITRFNRDITLPLAPFPGTMGVARAEPGQYSSVPPGRYAGNMDIRDFREGATLFVPVFVKGALLWSGDSHALQGNGEVNLCALETAFKELNITVNLIKHRHLEWPRIETPTHWITLGEDKDLNKSLAIARRESIKFLRDQRHLSTAQAERLFPAVADCRVSQVVDINKGVHCLLPKSTTARGIPVRPTTDTATFLATSARSPDLNKAMDTASWSMIGELQHKRGLTRLDAYALASLAMDCRVGAMGAEKSVHCVVPKSIWKRG